MLRLLGAQAHRLVWQRADVGLLEEEGVVVDDFTAGVGTELAATISATVAEHGALGGFVRL